MVKPTLVYTLKPIDSVLLAAEWYAYWRRRSDTRTLTDQESQAIYGELFRWEHCLLASVDRLQLAELPDCVVSNAPQDGA